MATAGEYLAVTLRNAFAAAPVVLLLAMCCPSAVFGAVATVIVNSVKCSAGGAGAHIRQEVGKHHPAFADRDTTPAILMEVCIFGIKAPLFHGFPCVVRSCSRHFVCPVQTPAGLGSTAAEVPILNHLYVSALASAREFSFLHDSVRAHKNGRAGDCQKAKHIAVLWCGNCPTGTGQGGNPLAVETPARGCVPGSKTARPYDLFPSTLATATPVVAFSATVGKRYYTQTPKQLTRKVFHGYFLAEASQNERWQTHARMGFSGSYSLASNGDFTTKV
jgi:hypothetical protein